MVLWFLCPVAPEGSPAGTPGLQDIGLSPTPWCIFHFCKLDNLIELLLLDVMCCYGIKFLPVKDFLSIKIVTIFSLVNLNMYFWCSKNPKKRSLRWFF